MIVISETATSTWHYHLRKVGPEGLKSGGGAPPALCGAKLGWDTKIPLAAWGTKDHIRQSGALTAKRKGLRTCQAIDEHAVAVRACATSRQICYLRSQGRRSYYKRLGVRECSEAQKNKIEPHVGVALVHGGVHYYKPHYARSNSATT